MTTTDATRAKNRALRAVKPIWHKDTDPTPITDFKMLVEYLLESQGEQYAETYFGFPDGSVCRVWVTGKYLRSNNPDAKPSRYHKAGISAYRCN